MPAALNYLYWASMASKTWTCTSNGPTTIEELRATLTKLASTKSGKALIDDKFAKDHIYAGHSGSVEKLAGALAKLRDLPQSTIMISSMDTQAKAEVLNWIRLIPASKLTFNNGTWTINTVGSTVPAVSTYKFATVDLPALKAMNRDDIAKKSRKWLTESQKTVKVACQFGTDGTPLIYHLDY